MPELRVGVHRDTGTGFEDQGQRPGLHLQPGTPQADRALDGDSPGLAEQVGDLDDVAQVAAPGGHPDAPEPGCPGAAHATRGGLDVDDQLRVDLDEQLLAEADVAEVVEAAGRADQGETGQVGAELSGGADLHHLAVAAQHVWALHRQGGDRRIPLDSHAPPDGSDRDPGQSARFALRGLLLFRAGLGGPGCVTGLVLEGGYSPVRLGGVDAPRRQIVQDGTQIRIGHAVMVTHPSHFRKRTLDSLKSGVGCRGLRGTT